MAKKEILTPCTGRWAPGQGGFHKIVEMDRLTCGRGWVVYNGSCYYFSTSAAVFKDAMVTCHGLGANMLELQNAEEEIWIDLQCRIRGYRYGVWLGVSDHQYEGKFISISNARSLSYSNWMKGEPNNFRGKEDCTLYWFLHRGWNDTACNGKINYVCKKGK
ncbi:perlucin-like protein [Saccostrea echinata]|uniref:perlucin-like protein n=1 Tax=Saccostrea echinata TaxID=191078 RepID=UPI002A7EAE35|nr:perlucin-like protein [Saccostrea echinata]